MEILKLMIEDINEADSERYHELQVHPMDNFDLITDYINTSEVLNRLDKDFSLKDKWFVCSDTIYSLDEEGFEEFLREKEDEIKSAYNDLEEYDCDIYNNIKIKEAILKNNLNEFGNIGDGESLYYDVNLIVIAEMIREVTVNDLLRYLSCYGNWEIIKVDGVYHLVEK